MTMTATRWFSGIAAGVVALGAIIAFAPEADAQRSRSRTTDNDATAEAKAVVGEEAPMFTLPDLEGEDVSIQDYIDDGKIVVLEWWNPRCPFIIKHHEKLTTMTDLAEKFEDDVVWVLVNSTGENNRDYGFDKQYVEEWNLGDMIALSDKDGKVGKTYGAQKTPHMFIIDTEGVLRYSGAIDNHPRPSAPTEREKAGIVNYVEQALEQIIAGETVTRPETRPYGCGVKYAS